MLWFIESTLWSFILTFVLQTHLSSDNILESTNATALDAWEAFNNRTLLFEDIRAISGSNQKELEALNCSVGGLQQQLELSLQAAASVSN